MTCIVGVEFKGQVYLAGDKQGTGWNGKSNYSQPKVFKNGHAIFGFCASYRYGQLLETALRGIIEPANRKDIYPWLCRTFIPEFKKVLDDGGCDEKEGNFLMGLKGQLWEVQNDMSVLRTVDGYAAIGSGEEYARGAFGYALKNDKPLDHDEMKKLLGEVINMTSVHCPSVGKKADICII